MNDEVKTAGIVALVGAAIGGGLALGMGLRLFTTIAMIGLGTGVALGIASGAAGPDRRRVTGPAPLLG